jgi:hypothetical protein
VYALNQVCRTTRHEFGPLYVAKIAHRIRVNEQLLPRFLHDFFLSRNAETVFALKPKKVEVELAYPLGVSPPRIDVLPLLSLSLGNEDLRCTFLNKFGPTRCSTITLLRGVMPSSTIYWRFGFTRQLGRQLVLTCYSALMQIALSSQISQR